MLYLWCFSFRVAVYERLSNDPSTGVTEFVATHSNRLSVVMEQAEDEISAINMAIGASYTGGAMTATSGGDLHHDRALSLAGG